MKAKCVLVTGASGFIGRPLVAALLRAGYAVRAVTRRPVSFPNVVEVVTIPDLKNSIDWAPILQGVDIIIHLAGMAHSHVPETEYSDVDQINRMATQQLAQAAKNAGVGRFIYISSVRAQIGATATHPVSEQDEPRPTDLYGRSKLAAEQAIRASGVPFTIFRPVVVYGPNPKGNMRTLVRLAQLPVAAPDRELYGPAVIAWNRQSHFRDHLRVEESSHRRRDLSPRGSRTDDGQRNSGDFAQETRTFINNHIYPANHRSSFAGNVRSRGALVTVRRRLGRRHEQV